MGGTATRVGLPRRLARRLARVVSVDDDRVWLGAALAAGGLVYLAYLTTHEYPAYGGGLYLAMAEQIRLHGYALPATVPHYTRGGVPFAYPPLLFYVAAAVRDLTGVGAITYSLYVPGLLVLGYLVPYYYTAKELLGSPRLAGFAATLFAVTPAALQWHLSAGGIARSAALLFAFAGSYTGLRLFRSGEARWLVPSAVLFGLVVLTHPVYTLFFVLTYLLLFVRFDPSPRGLAHGAVVALGGFVIAAPWLVHIVATHGPDVFTAAAGTHSGGNDSGTRTLAAFVFSIDPDLETPFYVAAYAGGAYALSRRRWFLPAWLAVPGYVIAKPRFQFVAGSMLTVLFVVEVLIPRVRRVQWPLGSSAGAGRTRRRLAAVALAGVVTLAAVGVGTAFAAGALDSHAGSRTQPAFIDDADREAMDWARHHTAPSADFVVLGDAAEWFPLFADRTSLIGPWGVEWTTADRYRSQLARFKRISDCGDAGCITRNLRAADVHPEYVVVPKDHYTIRGVSRWQSDRMRASLVSSDRYELVYENDGVFIVRYEPGRTAVATSRFNLGSPGRDGSPRSPDRSGAARSGRLPPFPRASG